MIYDAGRQLVLTVGPDPDGAGVMRPRGAHYSYNADGQVTFAEQGAVANQAIDGTGFVAYQVLQSIYHAKPGR